MSTISEQRRVGNRLCPLSWFAEPSILRDQGREGVAICAGSSMGFVIPCIFSSSSRSSVPSCAPIPFWSRSPLNFDNRISLRALRLQRLRVCSGGRGRRLSEDGDKLEKVPPIYKQNEYMTGASAAVKTNSVKYRKHSWREESKESCRSLIWTGQDLWKEINKDKLKRRVTLNNAISK